MKKILAVLAVAVSTSACAGPHHHHGTAGWFTPLIIGGALGYVYSQSQRPVQIIPQPGIIYQSPVYSNPPMQPVYQEVLVYDNDCTCYRKQYRQIGWQ